MWKEVVMVYLEVLSWHLPGGTVKTHEKPYESWSAGCDLNPGPPTFKAGIQHT
jgi:hypothetical protein